MVTVKQYKALCEVIDQIKADEKPEDTDVYAGRALQALDLVYGFNARTAIHPESQIGPQPRRNQ